MSQSSYLHLFIDLFYSLQICCSTCFTWTKNIGAFLTTMAFNFSSWKHLCSDIPFSLAMSIYTPVSFNICTSRWLELPSTINRWSWFQVRRRFFYSVEICSQHWLYLPELHMNVFKPITLALDILICTMIYLKIWHVLT